MLDDNQLSFEDHSQFFRWLQEENGTTTNSTASSAAAQAEDGKLLKETFVLYGSLLLVNILFFCWVRLRFPRPFTVRQWSTVEDLKSPLADDQFGFFSWIWNIYCIPEDDIMEYCGLDSLCFLRALHMGFKLSLVGIFNAIYLMPIYHTAQPLSTSVSKATATINSLTLSNVPTTDKARLVATVFAVYIFIFSTMYLILKEFEWFVDKRMKWLKKPRAQNYTIYVRSVPRDIRTNAKMAEFFSNCFSEGSVMEVNLRVTVANLAKAVSNRTALIAEFENAIALEDLTPTCRPRTIRSDEESLQVYAKKLIELNREITESIEKIERRDDFVAHSPAAHEQHQYDTEETTALNMSVETNQNSIRVRRGALRRNTAKRGRRRLGSAELMAEMALASTKKIRDRVASADFIAEVTKNANDLATSAATLVTGGEDGKYYSGGFVSFTSLGAANAARQLVHYSSPDKMKVSAAPHPRDVFWFNVGRTHKELQLGKFISMGATALTCLFWTIPMAYFSKLSSDDTSSYTSTGQEPAVNQVEIQNPKVQKLLSLLAPLLLIMFNAVILPYLLKVYSMAEGPISGSAVEASTFPKQSSFMIIQTFFVSAITGSLVDQMKDIFKDPMQAVDILANALPLQSNYFMRIAFIRTVVYMITENWRAAALSTALLRSFIGPRLTEKQRQSVYMGLRHLGDPPEFELSFNMSQICVLYFVILLVYQAIAPLTCFVLAFCFRLSRTAYLHQFIYIYPRTRDSGGMMWINFIQVLLVCMLIAEFTIVGYMALKKAGIIVPLLVPLIIVTFLFNAYFRQDHFRVTDVLPSHDYTLRKPDDIDLSFIRGQYQQEELRQKVAFPEGLRRQQAQSLGLLPDDEENGLLSDYDMRSMAVFPDRTGDKGGMSVKFTIVEEKAEVSEFSDDVLLTDDDDKEEASEEKDELPFFRT